MELFERSIHLPEFLSQVCIICMHMSLALSSKRVVDLIKIYLCFTMKKISINLTAKS